MGYIDSGTAGFHCFHLVTRISGKIFVFKLSNKPTSINLNAKSSIIRNSFLTENALASFQELNRVLNLPLIVSVQT